jgi:hypothetical protein
MSWFTRRPRARVAALVELVKEPSADLSASTSAFGPTGTTSTRSVPLAGQVGPRGPTTKRQPPGRGLTSMRGPVS